MGGLGSGAWEKHNRQIVGSCCEIDANHLSAGGCLEPGQSSTIPLGICNSPDDGIDRGGGGGVVVLNLRANEWVEEVCAENPHQYYAPDTPVPSADTPDF